MKTYLWAAAMLATVTAAEAAPKLSSGERWLTVASTKDLDEAIGIASTFRYTTSTTVFAAKSGWYAVALGPFKGSIADIQKDNVPLEDIPKDSLLSDGANYGDAVYTSEPEEDDTEYQVDPTAEKVLTDGTLTVKARLDGKADEMSPATVTGFENGKQVFEFKFGDPEEYVNFGATARVVNLDPTSDTPEIMISRYSGGAHCCTTNWVISKQNGAAEWTAEMSGPMDGEGIFNFRDIDGDGSVELLHVDNSFLYAFDSYASSLAPWRVLQLRGSKLVDVTTEPKFASFRRQDLAASEFSAKVRPDMFESNGFLAGWVAQKILVGEGDEAWAKMLISYQKASDFSTVKCRDEKLAAECPEELQEKIPFPKALAEHLKNNGYLPLPKDAAALLP
jgi:serine protease Do